MSSRVLTRVLLSVLAGTLCGVAVTCGVLLLAGPGEVSLAAPAGPAGPADSTEPTQRHEPVAPGRARDVLRTWDAARAAAWTDADPVALERLYTPRSVAGRRDVVMLRAWTERGARVRALTTQVLRLDVLVEAERRLVLVVTDRVARLEVAGATLPRDRPSTRRITLLRGPGGAWRVASVSPEQPARS